MTSQPSQREPLEPPKRPNMGDVAQLAGVGIKTVSRVINEEPHVTAETAQRVWSAISTLGYRPDFQAASLRRREKRSRMIGMMMAANPNPFWSEVRWAIEQTATEHDTLVLTSNLDGNADHERRLFNALISRRLDGLVIATPTRSHSELAQEQQHGMSVVIVDGLPLGVDSDAVLSDVRAGAALGTRHLIDQGHRKLAYFGADHSLFTISERRRGFLDEVARAEIGVGEVKIMEDLDEEKACVSLIEVMQADNPPTAIFAGQILVTRGVIRGLRQLGLQHDVALVGFDDSEMYDLLEPGITVIAQNPEVIGITVAERIFSRIEGDDSPSQQILLPVDLIQRGSGEIRPRNG